MLVVAAVAAAVMAAVVVPLEEQAVRVALEGNAVVQWEATVGKTNSACTQVCPK